MSEMDFKSEDLFNRWRQLLEANSPRWQSLDWSALWNISLRNDGSEYWRLQLRPQKLELSKVAASTATSSRECRISIDDQGIEEIFAKGASPQRLYLEGRLRIEGELKSQMKLNDVIRMFQEENRPT